MNNEQMMRELNVWVRVDGIIDVDFFDVSD